MTTSNPEDLSTKRWAKFRVRHSSLEVLDQVALEHGCKHIKQNQVVGSIGRLMDQVAKGELTIVNTSAPVNKDHFKMREQLISEISGTIDAVFPNAPCYVALKKALIDAVDRNFPVHNKKSYSVHTVLNDNATELSPD